MERDQWQAITTPNVEAGDVSGASMPSAKLVQRANQRIVCDLLDGIEQDREPAGSGEGARAALEMIQSMAAAYANSGRITLPLQVRMHLFAIT